MLNAESISSVVRAAMKECGYDPIKGRDALISKSETDPFLRGQLLTLGARQAIRSFFQNERRPEDFEIRAKAAAERRKIWERYAIFGQRKLADATVTDLRRSIAARQSQAAGNLRHARFEREIMKAMGDSKKTVSEFFSLNRIEELARKYHVI